ncbi:MAG: hypothetical protein ABSG53_21205 [Thermoguttaceae bacterium]|jgi:hypothetical protein
MIAIRHPGTENCASALLITASLFAAAPCLVGATDDIRQDALLTAEQRAAEITDRFAKTWSNYAVAEEWSRTDPARAAELADQLQSWTAKRDLLSMVMITWGQADPKAAGEWGVRFKQRTQGTLDQRNTALRYAVLGMVGKDPKLADQLIWKHLQEEQWGGTPRTAPMEVARELAKSDPAAALIMAEKITPYEPLRVDALRGILREWARKDPAAACAALGSRKEADFQKAFPRDLAEGWAGRDAYAAAAYAKTIEDRYTKVMALALVAREMVRTDPKGAAELCTIFAPLNVGAWHEQFPRLGMIVAEIGKAYAVKDLVAAAAWADSLPGKPGGCRANAIDGVAVGWSEKDPIAAVDYYTAAQKSSSKTDRPTANRGTGAAYPAIAGQLAKRDVPSALKLVSASESLVLKSHVIHDVAVELSRRDPAAAADLVQRWVGVVDYYSYRTGAASVVGAAWAIKEPKQAAAWAATLAPDRDRAAALRAVASAWAKNSPPKALAWAKSLQNPHDAVHALVGVAAGEPRN